MPVRGRRHATAPAGYSTADRLGPVIADPDLGVPTQPKGIAGVYDVSSDWTPIYDRTDLDGFYVAIGEIRAGSPATVMG